MQLRIEFRQYQNINLQGVPIVYIGPDPLNLIATPGQSPINIWQDMTNYVSNLDDIALTWTRDIDKNGEPVSGSFAPKKSASTSLITEGVAYQFLKNWLFDDVGAKWNAVEVRITDTSCPGKYEMYVVKSNQVQVCTIAECLFTVTLKQLDELYNCMANTPISDNWAGRFSKIPSNNKKHPRFSYCNEHRPNGLLTITWWLLAILETIFVPILFAISLIINAILAVVTVVATIIQILIDAVNLIPGVNISANINVPAFINPFDVGDAFKDIYLEASGCGREHPAPLIRDYIANVCDKCGVQYTPASIPLFFSEYIDYDASSGFYSQVKNDYYNACYFYAPFRRGIRRFKSINLFSGGNMNTDEFYIPENAPLDSGINFLDKLGKTFNHRWTISNGLLTFKRKDQFVDYTAAPLYDFSKGGPDENKIMEGVCMEWNGDLNPAYLTGLYSKDATDSCGNEVLGQVNGIVDFNQNENNPNFIDALDITVPDFGAARFRLDGAATDYIYDTMQVVCNGQVFTASLVPLMKDLDSRLAEYANYVLLMKDESASLPKIIIWDGESYLNAKAIRTTVPVNNSLVPNNGANPIPQPNNNYPEWINGVPQINAWVDKHPAYTDVKGAALTSGSSEPGVYEVRDYFGSIIMHNAARLVNYPMYFEPHYQGGLWDRFFWIDDPRRKPRLGMDWYVRIPLCPEDIVKLKMLGTGADIKLGATVKLPLPWNNLGLITEITASYKPDDALGRYIELKGIV